MPASRWPGPAAPGVVLPKLAYAQRLIASLSLVLLRQRDATGLIVFDDEVRQRHAAAGAARPHWRQLLATLSATKAGPGHGRRAGPQAGRRHACVAAGLVVFVSDLLLDRELALTALRFLRHRGHQVVVLHLMDPAEVTLSGPAEARFEDPETGTAVVLRPRDWAEAYDKTVRGAVSGWNAACRRSGISTIAS